MKRFALALALALTVPVVAQAEPPKTDQALDLQKAEVDFAKDKHKAVDKLAQQWHKDSEKGNPTAETEKELKVYYKEELAWLRDVGIPTVEDEPLPDHPQHPDKTPPEPVEDREKLIELRDLMVELKNMSGKEKPKPYGNKLDEFVKILLDRYERKDKAYEKAKEAAK